MVMVTLEHQVSFISDGTDTVWIDAIQPVWQIKNVGTNLIQQMQISSLLCETSSGNNPIRVDAGIKYNPSTNRLTAGSFAGDGSALTTIEWFCIWNDNIMVWAADAIPTGFVFVMEIIAHLIYLVDLWLVMMQVIVIMM